MEQRTFRRALRDSPAQSGSIGVLRLVLLAALTLLSACSSPVTPPVVSPAPPPAAPPPDPAPEPSPSPSRVVIETLRGLTVAPEDRCTPYARSDYRYASASLEEGIVAALGGAYTPYEDCWHADPGETDVEHIVALSEAHDSGLCDADPATRERFASDPRNLTLASPSLNRQKSGRDAADWIPPRNRCWFAATVVEVRRAYELTVDAAEAEALEAILAGCERVVMEPKSAARCSD